MIELTAVVHYRLTQPDDYLFEHVDPEQTIRVASESALSAAVNSMPLDDMLTVRRRGLEHRVADELAARMERYKTGVEVVHVRVQDIHPSVEVVDAFREVAGALEEKSRLINESEGYRNEQTALARGRAAAELQTAIGYTAGRVNRAAGDAERFQLAERGHRAAPAANATRLYLETMEEVLPGRRKLILDTGGGRRTLFSIEDSVMLAPADARMTQPPPVFQPPTGEEE